MVEQKVYSERCDKKYCGRQIKRRKMLVVRGESKSHILIWHPTTQVGLDSTSRNRDANRSADDALATANSRVTMVAFAQTLESKQSAICMRSDIAHNHPSSGTRDLMFVIYLVVSDITGRRDIGSLFLDRMSSRSAFLYQGHNCQQLHC